MFIFMNFCWAFCQIHTKITVEVVYDSEVSDTVNSLLFSTLFHQIWII